MQVVCDVRVRAQATALDAECSSGGAMPKGERVVCVEECLYEDVWTRAAGHVRRRR